MYSIIKLLARSLGRLEIEDLDQSLEIWMGGNGKEYVRFAAAGATAQRFD